MIPLGVGSRTTSSGQHLLQPNRLPSQRNKQTVLLEVTSRDRNYLQNVESNPIRYRLARPLKDVQAVELTSGTIPACPYNIVDGANSFTFQEGGAQGNEWVITIPPGYYTNCSLLAKLNCLFCCLGSSNTYAWSCDPSCHNLILTKTAGDIATFGLLFADGTQSKDVLDRSDGFFLQQKTLALQMGFDISNYYNIDCYLVSPFPMDLYSSINRLYLFINLQNSLDLGCIERGAGRRWPYAIIYLDKETNGYKYLNKETLTPASFSLPQPMGRVQDLYIEFRDEWHRLVNFNGKDFSLLLQFTVLE